MNATRNNRATATHSSTETAKVTNIRLRLVLSLCVIDVELCVEVLAASNAAQWRHLTALFQIITIIKSNLI